MRHNMPVRSTVLDGNGIVAQSVSQSVFDKEEQAPSHITVKEGTKKGGRYKVTKIATEPANEYIESDVPSTCITLRITRLSITPIASR